MAVKKQVANKVQKASEMVKSKDFRDSILDKKAKATVYNTT